MMSITFKITIPDGPLRQHLDGRDPKARNFELIRLATNDLIASKIGRTTNSSQPMEVVKSSEKVEKTQNKSPSKNEERNVKKKVVYGNALLDM